MSEEKKEEKQEKEVKHEKAEKKEDAKKEEALSAGSSDKRKKVSRMSIAEVEKELKVTQEKMGGLSSRYSLHLLLRKKELTRK